MYKKLEENNLMFRNNNLLVIKNESCVTHNMKFYNVFGIQSKIIKYVLTRIVFFIMWKTFYERKLR